MELKKQLIIIPPMSEPVKKLHEILEGISGDENFEISLIDDVRELTQFIATTGQCIILASNAKKCATFLQENKSLLQKNHCKTILFTPKEIPQKTLIKFTKVGLTESILESTPPKTFLYKVKLLLRSIKTAKPQEDAEKVVKSLEVNKSASEDSEASESIKADTEENVINLDLNKKRKFDSAEENTVDYGSNLKGKIKPQEEAIETHWKSDRKKHSNYSEEAGDSKVESLEDESNIDMYLRGKNKKTEELISEEEEPDKEQQTYDGPDRDAKKRKSDYQDIIDEGSMKQKNLGLEAAEEEPSTSPTIDDLDLLFEEALKKQKQKIIDEEQDLDERSREPALLEEDESKKKSKASQVEDLGGHLKGKISNEILEETPDDLTEEKEYDNSELGEAKEKSIELDLDLNGAKKSKENIEEESREDKVHESEVDKIDGNMIGDEGVVDKIRTRMEGRSNYKEKNSTEDTDDFDPDAKKNKLDDDDSNKDKQKDLNLDQASEDLDQLKDKPEDLDNNDLMARKKNELDLEGLDDYSRKKNDKTQDDDASRELEKHTPVEKLEKERNSAPNKEEEEEEKAARERELNNMQFAKTRSHTTHTGNVDKIDSFMRGGEAKKKEHSWDNLTDKSTKLELIPGSKKGGGDGSQGAGPKNDLGEQTIDYRKLKEEFDLIALGEKLSDGAFERIQSGNHLKNDDDEGSFKVIEVDSKSLDFSVNIISSIYSKDIKPKQILALLSQEMLSQHNGICVFFSYRSSEKKLSESYNMFLESSIEKVSTSNKENWLELKKDQALFEHFLGKSMSTWRCSEIIKNDVIWEDVELPTWAEQELRNKAVELIFPYFDGIDRMGMAYVLFPDGLAPKNSHSMLILLEMARTVFLDTIERYKVTELENQSLSKKGDDITPSVEPKKQSVLGFFGSLFGKKKAS